MPTQITTNASNVTRRAPSPNLLAVVSITAVLLLAFLTFAGTRAAGATGGQASTGNTATLPAGTRIMVTMTDSVDSETSQPDQRFRGTLEANLMAGDTVVAPKATTVFGRLLAAGSASGSRSGGMLEFDLTDILINGQTYSLATTSNQAQGQSAPSQTGTGATTGAAIGAVTGGMSGAVRGAGVGAAAGKVSSGNAQGEKVKIPAGALVEFSLSHPVTLPVVSK